MATWPPVALTALALLVTSLGAPAMLETGSTAPPTASSLPATPAQGQAAAAEAEPPAPGLPWPDEDPPASMSYSLFVSGLSPTSPPLYSPSPLSTAATVNGRAEDQALGNEITVKDTSGTNTLAYVKTMSDYAAAQTVTSQSGNRTTYWAAQARAHATVAYASLLNGQVTARLVEAHVFASANQRNASLPVRLDATASRIAEVSILGQVVKVGAGPFRIDIPAVGTLHINQTIADPAGGAITNYGLHLELINGMHIVVSGATALVGRAPLGPHGTCSTASETYPLGDKTRVLSELGNAKHNIVRDDPTGNSHSHGEIDDLPVEAVSSVAVSGVAKAFLDARTGPAGARAVTDSQVLDLNILNGLVTADLVKGVADANIALGADTTSAQGDADGSVLVNLRVGGNSGTSFPVEYTPAPNTRMPVFLPGNPQRQVAELVLNEQTNAETNNATVQLVVQRTNMIRLVVTGHELGLDVGTQVVVGHAVSVAACGMAAPVNWDFGDPLGLRT